MNNIDFIQINKFSELHNNNTVFFCKTDFILEEFDSIRKCDKDIVLITGNSDYGITDKIIEAAPKNIKKWFAQNALSNNEILEPLPIGLENKIESSRSGHGIGYKERMTIKEKLLSSNPNIVPSKQIYANFNISTNLSYRSMIKKICIQCPHIDWQDSNLTLEDLFQTISHYRMMVCPIGNGVDTHRLWEALYYNIIPITIKVNNYKIYKLYEQLPIIILNNIVDLLDSSLINTKYQEAIHKNYEKNLLTYEYWKTKILSYV